MLDQSLEAQLEEIIQLLIEQESVIHKKNELVARLQINRKVPAVECCSRSFSFGSIIIQCKEV
jgi:hypothetical protein